MDCLGEVKALETAVEYYWAIVRSYHELTEGKCLAMVRRCRKELKVFYDDLPLKMIGVLLWIV